MNNRVARPRQRWVHTALAVALAAGLAGCASSPRFEAGDAAFKGRVSVVETPVVLAGQPVTLAGTDFKPGQEVTLSYGGVPLARSVTADQDGKFRTSFVVPTDADVGRYALVASAAKPSASLLVPLKVSPAVPLSGQDRFAVQAQPLVPGLYQVAYSARTDRLFVSAAVGRPPVTRSELVRLDARTLAVEQRVSPPVAPNARAASAQAKPGLYAVYGIAVDDARGTVWVTNTRQDTVAVYRQSDLALLKQFEPGVVDHARDVVVDERNAKVFASPVGNPHVAVLDAKELKFLRNLPIQTTLRGPQARGFVPMSLALDQANSRLYVVSSSNEVAIIDTRTDKVEKVFAVEGAVSASGIAFDAQTDRVLVAAQGSDNLLIVDAKSGKTLHNVPVGAGALNVVFDPVRRLAYVANRAADTIAVVDADGKLVANLPAGSYPNHLATDGKGAVFAVNKARGANDPQGDHIRRIAPR